MKRNQWKRFLAVKVVLVFLVLVFVVDGSDDFWLLLNPFFVYSFGASDYI